MGAFLPPRESAHTHFGLPKGDLPKSFLHNWSFFFPSPLTYCWVRYFVSEQDLLCSGGRCVFVCVHKRYFGVYFQEPVPMWHEFLCWHLYYVCQQIPSFKCWRLTVHGDASSPAAVCILYNTLTFPALQGLAGAHMGLRTELCDMLLTYIKDRAQGKVDRPHTDSYKHTCPHKCKLLSYPRKVNAFTPW